MDYRSIDTQTVLIVGVGAFLFYKMRNSIIPNVASAIDSLAGTALRPMVVPPGSNEAAVSYWTDHGCEASDILSIAREGGLVVPSILAPFMPDSITAGDYFQAIFTWSMQTTIGDVQAYYGSPIYGGGNPTQAISDNYHYADAREWLSNEFDTVMRAFNEEQLWEVPV